MTPKATGKPSPFSSQTVIADAIDHGRDVAAVFIKYRMYCIGCTFARFENLKAAAVNHQVDVDQFVESLNDAAREAAEEEKGPQLGGPAIN